MPTITEYVTSDRRKWDRKNDGEAWECCLSAKRYYDQKEYDAAVELAVRGLSYNPQVYEITVYLYRWRGLAQYEKGDIDTAIATFSVPLDNDPANRMGRSNVSYSGYSYLRHNACSLHYNRGRARIDKGMFDGAIEDFDICIDFCGSYDNLVEYKNASYLNRGKAYLKKDMIEEAIADFKTCIEFSASYDNITAHKNAARENLAKAEKDEGYIARQKERTEKLQETLKKAEAGDAQAQVSLAFEYDKGTYVVQKDQSKAFYWFSKAAEQGYKIAQFCVAYDYANGEGVTQDYEKAVEWYKKAAAQGYADAMNSLGLCFQRGNGVKRNYIEAKNYFIKAIAGGSEQANGNLEKLQKEMAEQRSVLINKLFGVLGAFILGVIGYSILAGIAGFLLGWLFRGIRILGGIAGLGIGGLVGYHAARAVSGRIIGKIIVGVLAVIVGMNVINKLPNLFASKTESAATQTATATVNANVNFRREPSTGDNIIRQLKQGDIVTLTGETSGGWTQIQHGSDTGWVSATYLTSGTAQIAPQQTRTQEQPSTQTTTPQAESTTGEIAQWARGNYGNIAVNANSITGGNINITGVRTVIQPPLSGHPNLRWAYIYAGDKKYGVVWDRTTYANSWHEGIELGMGSEARSAFDFYSGQDKDNIFSDIAPEAPSIKAVK